MFPFLGGQCLVEISLGVIGSILAPVIIEIIAFLFLINRCGDSIKLGGNSLHIDTYHLTRPGEKCPQSFAFVKLEVDCRPSLSLLNGIVHLYELLAVGILLKRQ